MTNPPPPHAESPAPPHGGYQPHRPTNTMAVLAFIGGFVFAPLGIVFGHISRSQIKRTGEAGRGLATAGMVIGYVVTLLTVVVLVGGIAFIMSVTRGLNSGGGNEYADLTGSPRPETYYYLLPVFQPPSPPGANCQYPAAGRSSKPVRPPRTGKVPTDPAEVAARVVTSAGTFGLTLDNGKSPCTVNNFVSLAQQGYYDNTSCHRLTTAKHLGVLQCGDPTGTGTGGPGYRFPNEYPTNQYPASDPIMKTPSMMYPRGTLAMANAGPDTNGSQFFLVYDDSVLPATFTVFGTIDDSGLTALDKIAKAGVVDGDEDGKPAQPVTIESIRLD